jgi:S-adenosylmethionine synthetase
MIVRPLERSPAEAPIEIVERKGLGHPDTICDGIAEHVSARLCRAYLDRFGTILHHNVDKILLAGGAARPRFGGGEVTMPIELYLGGRATEAVSGARVPIADIAVDAAREWLGRHLPELDLERDVRIVPLLRPGSVNLAGLFDRVAAGAAPLANDTSLGAGFAPLTALERTVLDVERTLNAAETRRAHPEIGADIKVMGVRRGRRLQLTVACAFVARHVADLSDYLAKKAQLASFIQAAARRTGAAELDAEIGVDVNAADDVAAGDVYLTVSGTSAEAGDDGEVGRGNRANGLITPYRPMTLEAAAGKNPVNHVGKLYGVMSARIAGNLVTTVPGATDAECLMLSQIGRPVNAPQVVDVRARVAGGADAAAETERRAREVIGDELALFAELRDELVREAILPL